jgi:hypothetical protein
VTIGTASIKLFSRRNTGNINVNSPIHWIYSVSYIAMKAEMRPISNAFHPRVLDWVPMNIIDVPSKIGFVANQMLPKAPLP